MAAGREKERSLESTPSWAVAVVCFVLIAISIVIEQLIHRIETWLKKKRKSSLCEAHGKIKTELMLLGFMSLLLTAVQELISEICIPESVGHSWRPCSKEENDEQYQDPCRRKGKAQFISSHGINQLHRFIFALAVTHVVCSVTTLGLGGLKIRKWKPWEDETRTVQYQCHNDPERFRFARETTFVRRHLHFWSKSTVLLWIVCFFSQLFTSVAKVDYLTLRHGFITAHLTPQSQLTFNFQKYIKKSLEEDFKVVVGISPVIWLTAVLFLLTDSNGWYSHFWLPFFPLIIILLIGAKFQVIITKMGISILERGDVVKGTPIVQPGDDLFWFSRPRFTLFLIHFVLFQNAFQIAFLAWSSYEFGYPSCYHENLEEIIIRIAMGVLIQVLCSYVTLPLYALVSQMGSSVKPVIFSDQVVSALRAWYLVASKRLKQEQRSESTTPVHGGTSTTPVYGGTTPVHLLHGQRKYNQINKLGSRIGCSSGEGTSASPGHRDMTRNSRHLGDHINKVRIGGGSSGGGEGTSALPGHRDIDKTTRNSRYLIDHINKSRLGGGSGAGGEGTSASPGHSDIDDTTRNSTNLRDYIKKGRIGGGSGGGEGTSASPGHRDIDDTTRNSRHLGKMERGREEYKINQPQLDVEISSRDFSFRHKQNQ